MSVQPHIPEPRAKLEAYRIEILANALVAITEEVQMTLLRSAYSHNVKEGQDASCAIFTRNGHIVTQPVAIPGHLGSMKFMLAEVLKTFPVETLKAGDVIITNDPYRGGSHLPDIGMFRPVMHEGNCVAFTGCIIHHTDIGGMVPGGNPVRATELYQEGLVIPPFKLRDAGEENATLTGMIRANVRQPHIMLGDLHAQEAAVTKGEMRLRELYARYSVESVSQAMEMLIADAERKAREAVRAIPNGSYEFEDFMDHDGINLDKPIKIKVRLDVRDEALHFDFTGTDPQVTGPINAPLAKTWTTTFYCVSCILPADVPFNEGMTRILSIHIPAGTILNPRHPAPVNARTATLQRVVDVVFGALAQAVPERVGAQCSGATNGVSFGGIDPRTGERFVFLDAFCGAMGAMRTNDGADGITTGTSNPQNIPVEAVEMSYPVRILRYELVRDSGGSGEFRGGVGLRREYEMLAESATMNSRIERALFPPQGFAGGGNGAVSHSFLETEKGNLKQIPGKYSAVVKRGDRLVLISPGGGGYGDPARRSREQLVADYLDGKMSAEKILENYGVDVLAKVAAPGRPSASNG